MGIWDAFSEIVEAVTPWSVVEAEAPAEDSKDDQADESKDEDSSKDSSEKGSDDADAEGEGEGDEEGGDDDEDEEEDEDEEDEEEIVDPKETLEEECKNSAQCAPAKHHFDECVERVHQQEETDGEAKEDCVEEFFHLAHCASACAAPKLWTKLR
ncbi:ubiquionol cytochrome C reductase hinge protein [Moelleriella libera RCEF 2490]|uniref:Cytochrome b-c1 complex subunit 6, mitochondrial n=1 Tax=Moelleriella libera RCEF 2490 TaxID=1081109 RepID=A0A162IQ69_9HYPO|nr:ubiquionol cytochrome C reductase hinge protein [Moelleriella libera RCEF 2490]